MVDPLSAACLAGLTQIVGAVTLSNMTSGIVGNRANQALGAIVERFAKSVGHARNHDLQMGMSNAYQKALIHVAETISRQSRDVVDRVIANKIAKIAKRSIGQDDANAQSLIDAMDAILAPRRDVTQAELMRDAGDMMIDWLEAESGETLPPHFRALFHGDAPDGRPGWATQLRYEVAEQIKTEPRFVAIFTAEMLSELAGTTVRIETLVTALQSGMAQLSNDVAAVKEDTGAIRDDMQEVLALLRKQGAFQAAAAEGISEKAVRAIVEDLGGLGVEKPDLLDYIKQWIANVRDAMARHSNEGIAFEEARARSLALVREGRLAEAADPWMDLLAAEQAETQRRQGAILNEAIAADMLALNLDGLTDKLRMAARLAGGEDAWERGSYLFDRADYCYHRAHGRADNFALLCSIAAYRLALEELTRDVVPLAWATTQNDLGNALTALGERESGTALLGEAVDAYCLALEERTQEAVPLDWAATQNNLGTALAVLGEHEDGTARLEEAVDAFHRALEEWTQEAVPLNWAATQNNLGTALAALGEHEDGTARLEEAVDAFHRVLEEWTQEAVPLNWATTQTNLGTALTALGERESGAVRLGEAVDAFHRALEERTQEAVPIDWALTQTSLGNALRVLGERETGTVRLEQAVAAYRLALEELTPEATPYYHDIANDNLAKAIALIAEREGGA